MENADFVFREQVFTDVYVDRLAQTEARCLCALRYGRCAKRKCANCQVYKDVSASVSKMSTFDRARWRNAVAEYFSLYSRHPEHWYDRKRLSVYYAYWLVLVPLIAIVLLCLLGRSLDSPKDLLVGVSSTTKPSTQMDGEIRDTLYRTHQEVRDVNGDGAVNCQDYASTFRSIWLRSHYSLSCEIIRNVNPRTGMNHVFIRVWGKDCKGEMGRWCIEPQATSPYLMEEVWGKRYNQLLNIVGETERWQK